MKMWPLQHQQRFGSRFSGNSLQQRSIESPHKRSRYRGSRAQSRVVCSRAPARAEEREDPYHWSTGAPGTLVSSRCDGLLLVSGGKTLEETALRRR